MRVERRRRGRPRGRYKDKLMRPLTYDSINMRIIIIIIFWFLSGCATNSEQAGSGFGGQKGTAFTDFEAVNPDQAQIYIYRPWKFFWLKAYPNVSIDGQMAGELRNGTYIVAEVPTGEHTVIVHRNRYWAVPDTQQTISVKPGQTIFLKIEPQLENIMQVALVLASAGAMAESTGIGIVRDNDFDGAASSTMVEKGEANMQKVFQKLFLSNKYYIKN